MMDELLYIGSNHGGSYEGCSNNYVLIFNVWDTLCYPEVVCVQFRPFHPILSVVYPLYDIRNLEIQIQ